MTVFHNTTPDLHDQDQDRFFWPQTGLVLRPTVSDHITAQITILSIYRLSSHHLTSWPLLRLLDPTRPDSAGRVIHRATLGRPRPDPRAWPQEAEYSVTLLHRRLLTWQLFAVANLVSPTQTLAKTALSLFVSTLHFFVYERYVHAYWLIDWLIDLY